MISISEYETSLRFLKQNETRPIQIRPIMEAFYELLVSIPFTQKHTYNTKGAITNDSTRVRDTDTVWRTSDYQQQAL